MSTIASPREVPRRMNSSQAIVTPTSSSRPSLDIPRSAAGSPNPNSATTPTAPTAPAASKRNRAALREYYNLKAQARAGGAPSVEVTDALADAPDVEQSEIPPSELDREGFEADAYVKKVLAENGLEDLLRTYTRILGEVRALDAEKKALVYDNYSKLITATETIRKMRANMDPLNPMASTLDPAIAQIYTQASAIRDSLRKTIPAPADSADGKSERSRKLRTKQLALEVLATPERIRRLVKEGKIDQARRDWEMPRKLLETWKQKGLGGADVQACIEDGEAALRGEEGSGDESGD